MSKLGHDPFNLNKQILEYIHSAYLKQSVDLGSLNEILSII